jgi:hypothetical protein
MRPEAGKLVSSTTMDDSTTANRCEKQVCANSVFNL